MSRTSLALLWRSKSGELTLPKGSLVDRQLVLRGVGQDEVFYVINARRLAVYGILLASVCYFGVAAILWAHFSRLPANRVTFSHVALPWRWSEIPSLRAESNIEAGFRDLAEQRWLEGIARLESGLRVRPDSTSARTMLAEIYLRTQRGPRAVALLVDGLAHHKPSLPYLQMLASTVRATQDYRQLIGVYRQYGAPPHSTLGPAERAFLHEAALAASVKLRELPLLRELWEQAREERNEAAAVTYAAGLLSLASVSEGELALESLKAEYPDSQGLQNLAIVARRLRGEGDRSLLQALEAVRQSSATPAQTVFVITEFSQNGNQREADAIIAGLPEGPPETTEILTLLATHAHQLPQPGLLFRSILARAEQLGMDPLPVLIPLCETHLRFGNLSEAQEVLVAIQKLDSAMSDATQQWARCMQAVIFAGSQDTSAAGHGVLTAARQASLSAEGYAWIVDALLRCGSLTPAANLADFAAATFPQSAALRRVQAIAQQAQLIRRAERQFVATPRPANTDSDYVALATLKVLADEGRHQEVIEQISRIRASNPQWLTERTAALERAEVHSLAWLSDTLHFRAVTLVFLRNDVERAKELLPLLEALSAAQPPPAGYAVLRQLLERQLPELAESSQ
jgi:hypothetical protein